MTALAPEALVGGWRLERFSIAFADDRPPIFPFGEDARGLITYCADGTMSAVLSRAERPGFGGRLETAGRATEGQRAAAFSSYLSYAGTWHLDGDQVVHTVELALAPDAVGQANRRRATLDGDRLTLSYDITPRSGTTRRYTLIWRRVR